MMLTRLWNFIKLTRPVFLLGGMMLYALGALTAVIEGAVLNVGRLVLGQVLVTSIQLMTHYANEYYDLHCDRLNTARTWFSGGSGVLSDGLFVPEMARHSAYLAGLIAILALAAAGLQVPAILPLGAVSLAAAWFYSAPPLKLVGSGWGELAASLIVAFMVPVVGFVMQSGGPVSPTLLMICLPLILIHFAMLIAFQIPDWQADQAVGKRTLSVRLGLDRVARLHNGILLAACLVLLGLVLSRWPGAQLVWIAAPLAFWQVYSIGRQPLTPTRRYLWLTMGAVGLFALTAALWLAGSILRWMGT